MEKIAVLIPCYNEEKTIKKVVEDWKKELPEATIYVYNNNSTDCTVEIAKEAGAIVRNEYQQGKGNVIRPGKDVLLISMGILLKDALDAAKELEKDGISVEVVDMYCLKPLDAELIRTEMQGKKALVTFENHNVINGLGSAVAAVLAEEGAGIPLRMVGVEDRFGQVGSLEFLKQEFGLTKEHVVQVIRDLCSEK